MSEQGSPYNSPRGQNAKVWYYFKGKPQFDDPNPGNSSVGQVQPRGDSRQKMEEARMNLADEREPTVVEKQNLAALELPPAMETPRKKAPGRPPRTPSKSTKSTGMQLNGEATANEATPAKTRKAKESEVPSPARITRARQREIDNQGVSNEKTVNPAPETPQSVKKNDKNGKRKAQNVAEDSLPETQKKRHRNVTPAKGVTHPGQQNVLKVVVQQTLRNETYSDGSPVVYDPHPRPVPHGSSGRGILKNGVVPSSSLSYASDTSREQASLSTTFISNTHDSILATSQIMDSGPQLNQSEQSFSKKTTINENNNHTRYILRENFNPTPLKQRATQVHVLTKSSSSSHSKLATRYPLVSRSQPDTTIGLRREHRASSETPGNNTPQMRTPNKDLNRSTRSDSVDFSSNRSTRSDSVDFNSVGFVNKMMRHIERDENRELVSILLRDTVGDIICEEMCKGENCRKCFQNVSTKLNDAQLFKVADVLLGPKVKTLIRPFSRIASTSTAQHQPGEGESEGFLRTMFDLFSQATNNLRPEVLKRKSTTCKEDFHKTVFQWLTLYTVKNSPETLKMLKEEKEPQKSMMEQLEDFHTLIENNKYFKKDFSGNGEIMLKLKLISNRLFEIIPEHPITKYNTGMNR